MMRRHDVFVFLGRALSPVAQGDEVIAPLGDDMHCDVASWDDVLKIADSHFVTPGLCQALMRKGLMAMLPDVVQGYLKIVHCLNAERNRAIAEQLLEIVFALRSSGVEPVLLKGVAHLTTDLYGDSAARVIGDIDLLVPREQLLIAVDALAAGGYQEAGIEDIYYHHHAPLAHNDRPACVELHTDPVVQTFSCLLSAERVMQGAHQLTAAGNGMRVPSLRDQVVHNIVHAQLADRDYWCGRISLRQLSDLSRLRTASDGEINWEEVRDAFDRAGYGDACRTYLLAAERLFGQAMPPELEPGFKARLAYWQVDAQSRYSWLMQMGALYGYHRAILNELSADSIRRRSVLSRLLHPAGYLDYLRYLKKYVGRVG